MCFDTIGGRKRLRGLTVRDVDVGNDDEIRVFFLEEAGWHNLNEVCDKKRVLEMLEDHEMDEMDIVFEKAKEKAVLKIEMENGKKYTATPWKDFTIEFLVQKLEEEIEEWKEKYDKKELLDIINVAAFIYLYD